MCLLNVVCCEARVICEALITHPVHTQPHLPTVHNDVFYPIVFIILTLGKINNMLPEDGC